MEIILSITDQDLNPELKPPRDREGYYQRHAARAVVFDDESKVGLLYVASGDYYKLPGGGIEEGEDILLALERELLEEIGCEHELGDELGIVEEVRDYWQMKQTSYAYLARVKGEKGEPNFTEEELGDGFSIEWHPIEKAIELMEQRLHPKNDIATLFMSKRDLAILQAAHQAITR